MKYCSINGTSITNLDINDRGLAYGDGLFTTAKIVDGRVELLNQHVKRLIDGCDKLAISLPTLLMQGKLTSQLKKIAKDYPVAVLKVVITAGSGGRGYSRLGLNTDASNIIIMVFDYPLLYETLAQSGISLGTSQQCIAISPMLSGIKHLNRLEQVLIRRELDDRNEDDLVVCNALGQVVEASSANLFYWLNGKLCTPNVSVSGVDGLMRQFIMVNYNKRYNRKVIVEETTLAQLRKASAMFICNSVMGVMPVKIFENNQCDFDLANNLRNEIQELMRD